jgi:hypothetical protein
LVLSVENHRAPAIPRESTAVADLSPGLGVERCLGEDRLATLSGAQQVFKTIVADQRCDLARVLEPIVTHELRPDALLGHPLVFGAEVRQEIAAP